MLLNQKKHLVELNLKQKKLRKLQLCQLSRKHQLLKNQKFKKRQKHMFGLNNTLAKIQKNLKHKLKKKNL